MVDGSVQSNSFRVSSFRQFWSFRVKKIPQKICGKAENLARTRVLVRATVPQGRDARLNSSVLLSVLVLVPVVGLAGFCAGVVCVWQLCSGKMLFLGMPLELL